MLSADVVTAVCERIANGESAEKILRELKISWGKWSGHVAADTSAAEEYARAMQARTHLMAEEIIRLSDESQVGVAFTAKAKLQVDARKWLMAKLMPKRYGEHVSVDLGGRKIEDMTDAELVAIVSGRSRGSGDAAQEGG